MIFFINRRFSFQEEARGHPTDNVNPLKTVVFAYDKKGNLKTYNDSTMSAEYFYDEAYRKTSETVNYGPFERTYNYTYYKNGTKKSFTGPDSITYEYTYDTNNQLTGVQIPGKGSITYTSYTWNRPASMTLPGGSTKQFAYDPLMRTKTITAKDPGHNMFLNYQYNYDKMDNILSKGTEHGGYAYGYDDLYRLTGADNPIQDDEAFAYDPVGNRLTAEGVTGNWSYNDNNELLSYDDVSYVYDANGNMTQKTAGTEVTNYFYNIEDRLERVEDNTGTVIASYYYDPFGRRLWKEVSGVRRYFLYADEGLIGEYDASGAEIKTYGYKPDSTWTTDPLFMKQGGNYYFYQNDHLGTPQKMTAVNGAVVWSAKYSSFGKADVEIETVENRLRFPGQYCDIETGLHYNYFRYYDPKIGRYLRVDPIGIAGGENLFSYAENKPPNLIDVFGLDPFNRKKRKLDAPIFDIFKPTDFTKPSQPLPGYNWCGAGNNGLNPTNPLDAACKRHDECYEDCGISHEDVSFRWPGQDKGPSSQDDCDDELCEAAGVHGGWIRIGVKYLFCD